MSTRLVRRCPNCGSARASMEVNCENVVNGDECGWNLSTEPLVDPHAPAEPPQPLAAPQTASALCVNGHPLEEGDQVCMVCGGDLAPQTTTEPTAQGDANLPATVIDGWTVHERLPGRDGEPWERFLAGREDSEEPALLTLYCAGAEPDPAVHDALRRMPTDHTPRLFATGRFNGRAYDVTEHIRGGSLSTREYPAAAPERFRILIDEIGRALSSFAEIGMRHRELRPDTVLIRGIDSFDLVIVGFGSARLSDFDLEAVAPLQLTRYSAPEAIVGAVSAASDWWSLGMIALEQATQGACFDGVNDQAFLLHVVTRGMTLPPGLDPDARILLRGLLARDPLARWSWTQVHAWLQGELVEPPPEEAAGTTEDRGPAISLGGRLFRRPEAYALAASEAANHAEGTEATLRGAVATWLDERGGNPAQAAEVRHIVSDPELADDAKHALAMMVLNRDLPLALGGEIVSGAWLLTNPERGSEIVTGAAARHLERLEREPWLVRLRIRAEAVRERARLNEIELDEQSFRLAMLTTSRANLEAEREARLRFFPDTDHARLASILDKSRVTEDDLVLLVSASLGQFTPLASLVEAALGEASQAGVAVELEAAQRLLARPRREIFSEVDGRIANFARCGSKSIDNWADEFRTRRRMLLPRAAVLLAVPPERWREPPKQQYVSSLLEHFEKRVSSAIGRGSLVRFLIGKTTPRIDLAELGTSHRGPEALVAHVLARTSSTIALDPAAYRNAPNLEARLRRLVSHASMFQRDTGIDGRYMGFPFLLVGDGRRGRGSARPRIAPVLLWPVAFEFSNDAAGRAARLAFRAEGEEVRLNPALESIVGGGAVERWRRAKDDLLARDSLRVADVMDVLAHLAAPQGRALARIPGRDATTASAEPELVAAAALFHAEFTGQAVAEEIRLLRGKPIAGTSLEAALRIVEPGEPGPVPAIRESDCYNTVESDPSQDDAVLRSRSGPGLLVEGPPGTGKSQTIVNMVANAVGHGETVLVVCQKLAALKVVEKRLKAEGLGDRLFLLADVNRDRTSVVNALRTQVPAARTADPGRVADLGRRRQALAARIEALEGEIDRHHAALYSRDQSSGISYRGVVGQLIEVEASGLTIDAPRLRTLLSGFDEIRLAAVEETCGPLARDWLRSRFEGSPLAALKPFAVDDHVESAFRDDFGAFLVVEQARASAPADSAGFETDDPMKLKEWMAGAGTILSVVLDDVRARLATWLDLFRPVAGGGSLGSQLRSKIEELSDAVGRIDPKRHDPAAFEHIAKLSPAELETLIEDFVDASTEPNFFQWLNPFRWGRVERAIDFVAKLGKSKRSLVGVLDLLKLEHETRPLRAKLHQVHEALRSQPPLHPSPLNVLVEDTKKLLNSLLIVERASAAVLACPAAELAEQTVRQATEAAYSGLHATFEGACARHEARQRSRGALSVLSAWLEPGWLAECETAIERNSPTARLTAPLVAAFQALAPYQRVRMRMGRSSEDAVRVLSQLRQSESLLNTLPTSDLDGVVRKTIRREALLAWKNRLEGNHPELLSEREEIEAKVHGLAQLDSELRDLNRRVLAAGCESSRLGTQGAWTDLTMLRGPRAKTVREILDQGQSIGLMQLRPIWLMIPDVASRVLPLRAGLFDLVIYDEASQMPVEHAVPTLFRGRRVVVSGDEKQMPPSAFFTGAIEDDDEAQDADEVDENATEGERAAADEAWNRREVKDCPDLLQLGRWALPKAILKIHYRSNYRELIGFSNAAFYSGALSVPVRHPDSKVRQVRPIEVDRVDGTYASQTNSGEAERVVEILADIWLAQGTTCPSVGVVSFNRKQADLIEDALEERAAEDPAFAAALRRERDRKQDGEDMSFFVKNVENVQGDERDAIIFSTTFGRDARGTFRRSFGVLGQTGGERRLNVAITRARSKVILVTSIPVSEVSDWLQARRRPDRPRDYLQAYLDYASKLDAGDLEAARSVPARLNDGSSGPTDDTAWDRDGFRESVGEFVRQLGYDPVSAEESGDVFSMDYAIVDPATRLFGIGIECESPRHELLTRARAREIWRAAVLRRAVPALHRVSVHAWYHRPQHERTRLRSAIESALQREAA